MNDQVGTVDSTKIDETQAKDDSPLHAEPPENPKDELPKEKEETGHTRFDLKTMADVVLAAQAQLKKAKVAKDTSQEPRTLKKCLTRSHLRRIVVEMEERGEVEEIYGTEHRGAEKPKKVLFGIGKRGMQRTVVHFQEPPEAHPLKVYFDFPNSSLSHRYIYYNIKHQLSYISDASVVEIQFQDRNVLFGSRTIENRWIVQLNSARARDALVDLGLIIFNRRVKVSLHTEGLNKDYEDFLKYCNFQKKMYNLTILKGIASGLKRRPKKAKPKKNSKKK